MTNVWGATNTWNNIVSGASGDVTQTASIFSQSAQGGITLSGVTGDISQELSLFTQSGAGLSISDTSGIINQVTNGFNQLASGKIPTSWIDKPPTITDWSDKN